MSIVKEAYTIAIEVHYASEGRIGNPDPEIRNHTTIRRPLCITLPELPAVTSHPTRFKQSSSSSTANSDTLNRIKCVALGECGTDDHQQQEAVNSCRR